MADGDGVLTWLHIGDLHMTEKSQEALHDLLRIVALAQGLAPGSIDFAVLPGDNADDGSPEQFRLVRDAVAGLPMPLHILPGDHDFAPGHLDAFHGVLGAAPLPHAVTVRGHRCLFLDVVSEGAGGGDFRLSPAALAWVAQTLAEARQAGQDAVVFMHCYPADLQQGSAALQALLAQPHVRCVDMGHTHYNELANDGRTVFMATRSTGQAEEGPPGFSVAAVDGGGVSWRFKALDDAWPLVLVTAPVDRRLAVGPARQGGAVRAKVLGDAPILSVEMACDDGGWTPMAPVPGQPALWQAAGAGRAVRVRARDALGRCDEDGAEPASPGALPAARRGDGSDADRVGAWPEKGILGTQLGPNRNGRAW